jgi:hypothetical protein
MAHSLRHMYILATYNVPILYIEYRIGVILNPAERPGLFSWWTIIRTQLPARYQWMTCPKVWDCQNKHTQTGIMYETLSHSSLKIDTSAASHFYLPVHSEDSIIPNILDHQPRSCIKLWICRLISLDPLGINCPGLESIFCSNEPSLFFLLHIYIPLDPIPKLDNYTTFFGSSSMEITIFSLPHFNATVVLHCASISRIDLLVTWSRDVLLRHHAFVTSHMCK